MKPITRWRTKVRDDSLPFGVVVDTAGDGFFARSDGPARAIRCAMMLTILIPKGTEGSQQGPCHPATSVRFPR
jgi:hypothetical protein